MFRHQRLDVAQSLSSGALLCVLGAGVVVGVVAVVVVLLLLQVLPLRTGGRGLTKRPPRPPPFPPKCRWDRESDDAPAPCHPIFPPCLLWPEAVSIPAIITSSVPRHLPSSQTQRSRTSSDTSVLCTDGVVLCEPAGFPPHRTGESLGDPSSPFTRCVVAFVIGGIPWDDNDVESSSVCEGRTLPGVMEAHPQLRQVRLYPVLDRDTRACDTLGPPAPLGLHRGLEPAQTPGQTIVWIQRAGTVSAQTGRWEVTSASELPMLGGLVRGGSCCCQCHREADDGMLNHSLITPSRSARSVPRRSPVRHRGREHHLLPHLGSSIRLAARRPRGRAVALVLPPRRSVAPLLGHQSEPVILDPPLLLALHHPPQPCRTPDQDLPPRALALSPQLRPLLRLDPPPDRHLQRRVPQTGPWLRLHQARR